jgi:hypothetical protein
VVRPRFNESTIAALIESQWWRKSVDELAGVLEEFQKPMDGAAQLR